MLAADGADAELDLPAVPVYADAMTNAREGVASRVPRYALDPD
jgi:hypothetical protein